MTVLYRCVCVVFSFSSVSVGRPGSPGGNDLVSALRRLTLRRQNFLCERQYFQAERNRKLHELSDRAESEGGGSGYSSPMGSVCSSFTNLSEFSVSSSCFKTFLPEKLQIVKPMEGESLFLFVLLKKKKGVNSAMFTTPYSGTLLCTRSYREQIFS